MDIGNNRQRGARFPWLILLVLLLTAIAIFSSYHEANHSAQSWLETQPASLFFESKAHGLKDHQKQRIDFAADDALVKKGKLGLDGDDDERTQDRRVDAGHKIVNDDGAEHNQSIESRKEDLKRANVADFDGLLSGDNDEEEFVHSLTRLDGLKRRYGNDSYRMLAAGRDIANERKFRTLCTVVKDMTRYLREWIEFHLLVGWDKFVIYDHRSTDGLKGFIEREFPLEVVQYVNITWRIPGGGQQKMSHAQETSFEHCFNEYWEKSEVLSTIDVDEFIYPAKHHWSDLDPLGSAMKEMGFMSYHHTQTAAYLLCVTHGFGKHMNLPNGSVVASYDYRAPILQNHERAETDAGAEYQRFCEECDYPTLKQCHDVVNRTIPYCRLCRFCIHVGPLPKHLYFPNGAAKNVWPQIHHMKWQSKSYKYLESSSKENNTKGILCNHYRFQAYNDILWKTLRNQASRSFSTLPFNHPYFELLSSVKDGRIKDFLRARRRVLMDNNIFI